MSQCLGRGVPSGRPKGNWTGAGRVEEKVEERWRFASGYETSSLVV